MILCLVIYFNLMNSTNQSAVFRSISTNESLVWDTTVVILSRTVFVSKSPFQYC